MSIDQLPEVEIAHMQDGIEISVPAPLQPASHPPQITALKPDPFKTAMGRVLPKQDAAYGRQTYIFKAGAESYLMGIGPRNRPNPGFPGVYAQHPAIVERAATVTEKLEQGLKDRLFFDKFKELLAALNKQEANEELDNLRAHKKLLDGKHGGQEMLRLNRREKMLPLLKAEIEASGSYKIGFAERVAQWVADRAIRYLG